jgi:O-antigen/teichoic acid export membrane protein
MRAKQTLCYLLAYALSAVFGLANVVIFTRLFAVEAFGDFNLGFSCATFFAVFLASAIKLALLRIQARGDSSDVRPVALGAMVLCGTAAPIGFGAALLIGLPVAVALAAVTLTLVLVAYDCSLELLRAEQKPKLFVAATFCRALLVTLFGLFAGLFQGGGASLLATSVVAYSLVVVLFWRRAWGVSEPDFARPALIDIVRTGAPLTLSLSLLSISSLSDRFLLAHLAGIGAAGQFGAALDIVRQGLPILAVSLSSAFTPLAVRMLAGEGAQRTRDACADYLEWLLAVTLPATIGLALVAPQVADLLLGPDFRQLAREAIPVFAAAVLFQVLTQQYFHMSFLLSNKTIYYLFNTGAVIVWSLAITTVLILRFGVAGAVWGRLATELFGFASAFWLSRSAFALPFPFVRLARVALASAPLALAVYALESLYSGAGPKLLLLAIPAGVAVYALSAWALDIARARARLRNVLHAIQSGGFARFTGQDSIS